MMAHQNHQSAFLELLMDSLDLDIPQNNRFAPSLLIIQKLLRINEQNEQNKQRQNNCLLAINLQKCFQFWQANIQTLYLIILSGVRMQNSGIRFLVATDIHLGHREKHSVRHNDSYQGFEEVIDYAKSQNVDFLLLGGDLFDQVNPSKECFFRCLNILRQNVFGNRHVDLKVTLNGKQYKSNLQNQDFNISLPIFTIHGNHDYPTNEFGKISACDLLQASNYVNYFGKYLNLQNIVIRPLIITKGGTQTKIALYGLGYIKDQVLNELFQSKRVKFQLPQGNIEDYFKIFVFHQNRYKKGFRPGAPIHQSFNAKNIPEWMNLVIWGHEHQAIYKIQTEHERTIYQPGSTVLTSYIETESYKKQCVLINAVKDNFQLQSLLLEKSYRPMRIVGFDSKLLRNQHGVDFNFTNFLEETIKSLIEESLKESNKKPIIRIKIQCSNLGDSFNARTIQAKYFDKVANGDKILMLWRRKAQKQIKMEDDDVLRKIKNKQIQKTTNTTIQQVQNIINGDCQKIHQRIFQQKKMLQIVSYLAKADNCNSVDIVKKKCAQMVVKHQSNRNQNLTQFTSDKQIQFKRSLKYLYDKKQFVFNKIPDTQFYNYRSKQQFFFLRNHFLNQNKYMLNSKIMQEFIDSNNENTQHSKTLTINNSSKSASSFMTRTKKQDSSHSQRSDSQDCCQRAQRTPIDEMANKINYKDSQQKLNKAMKTGQYKKKPVLSNTKKQSEPTQEKKVMKNVKFSVDFM